jgi:DNA-binding MarR family transcriptional regulator
MTEVARQTATALPNGAAHAAEMLVHLARLVHGVTANPSLTPAQWTALRYFASANRFSRTPSAFSEFHATTRGTASQTVKALIALGLLERHTNEADARSTLIEVTAAGHARLCEDPLGDLIRSIDALPPADKAAFTATLARLGTDLARSRAAPTFGKCGDCGHCDTKDTASAYCRCTQSILNGTEMDALCIDFAPNAPKLR